MSLLGRIRERLAPDTVSDATDGADALSEAERLLRDGASVARIRRLALDARASGDIQQAWRALFLADLDTALAASYAAADARPYDVDSRIVHGITRLARNELDQAAHEFDAVIEEFGAEADAADGRRAVILARGHAPLDEIAASADEWRSAATLLTALWRVADIAERRLSGLAAANPDGLHLITQALQAGHQADAAHTSDEHEEDAHGPV